jgi:ribosome-associated protein
MIDVVLKSLEDAKAEETVAIDVTGKSSLSDHMVVTTGRSNRHVGAVADQLVKALREAGFGKPRVEGLPHCDWVLVDGGDVIVHIFRPEVREFYNIEKMWSAEFAADPV